MPSLFLILTLSAATLAAASEAGSRWTGFRGTGDSATAASKLPLVWSHDRNIAWRLDVPGMGQSTPLVFDGRIFLTSVEGPRKEKLNVFAFDLATGKQLWHRQMPSSRPHPTGDRVSRAAPTPAAETGRLYVLFDSGDLFALTHEGKSLWHVDFNTTYGQLQGGHDFGSSLRLSGGFLYVHVSQAKPSYLIAVRGSDGSTGWRREMPLEGGYGTPVVTRHNGRDLLLTASQGGILAFDAESGAELWRYTREGGRAGIPSLSAAGGFVVAASAEKGKTFAIALNQPGKPAWTSETATTQYSSPLIHGERVYLVNAVGVLFVIDLRTGRLLSSQRLPGPCWASAIGASNRLYFFTTEGTTVVLRPGDRPEKLHENLLPVGGTVYSASPAPQALLIRTGTELWKLADVGTVKSYATEDTGTGRTANPAAEPPVPPPSSAKPGDHWTNPRDRHVYVLLPAGTFQMGCPKDQCAPDEAPARSATIEAPFWIGRTEVSVAAYRLFVASTGGRMPEEPMLLDRSLNPRWRRPDLPILNLTASQAEAFCAWIGGRLPTETEWEYAARAGASGQPTQPTRIWSAETAGSQPLDPATLLDRRGLEEKLYSNENAPHPAGTSEPNAFGLTDMLGNASEWTAGLFDDLPPVIRGGPPSPPGTPFRVSRGGSFLTPASRARPTSRQRHTLDGRMESTGFRCVANAKAQ